MLHVWLKMPTYYGRASNICLLLLLLCRSMPRGLSFHSPLASFVVMATDNVASAADNNDMPLTQFSHVLRCTATDSVYRLARLMFIQHHPVWGSGVLCPFVCLFVRSIACLFVCPPVCRSKEPQQNFLCMLSVAVDRSSSGGAAVAYVMYFRFCG